MNKLFLMSVFCTSGFAYAQENVIANNQQVTGFTCVDHSAQNNINDEEIADYIKTYIEQSQDIPLGFYFGQLTTILADVSAQVITNKVVAGLFCMPKLCDEKSHMKLFQKVFTYIGTQGSFNNNPSFNQLVAFLHMPMTLQEIMTDSADEQEQETRLYARETLIRAIHDMRIMLVENVSSNVPQQLAQEVAKQTELAVKAFKVAVAQRAQAQKQK